MGAYTGFVQGAFYDAHGPQRTVAVGAALHALGFGSLWASSHPGTASMGKLLMISLVWTLVSALLFQPALMGPPPKDAADHA